MSWLSPELLSVIFGFIVPPLVSFLKSSNWRLEYKTLLCGAVSAVAAIVSLAVTGELSVANFGVNLPIVFASATAFYNLKFRDLSLNTKMENSGVGS
jgi:hypothetical protein